MHSQLDDGWQIENKNSGLITFVTTKFITQRISEGSFVPHIPRDVIRKRVDKDSLIEVVLSQLTPDIQREVKIKRDFVIYFCKIYDGSCTLKRIEAALNKFWNSIEMGKRPSPSTAYRWIRKYKSSGEDIISLISKESDRGRHNSPLPEELIELCHSVIKQFYLNKNRITVERLYEKVQIAIDRENQSREHSKKYSLPSISTIRRLIAKIGKYDVDRARYGDRHAQMKYNLVVDQTPSRHINHVWEIDHTPMDVFALDDDYGTVIARPYLTTLVEIKSKCLMAAYVSFESNDALRVLHAFKEAILPKNEILKRYPTIENTWPCHGLPDVIVSDRGKEFLSNDFMAFCMSFNIETLTARAFFGNDKGTVERTAGIINRQICMELPGKTFSSVKEKGHGYNPKKDALVSLDALKKAVYEYVCDVRHQSFHRDLGMTPMQMWKTNVQDRDIRFPSSTELIDANIFQSTTRKLTKEGIELNRLAYTSKDLERLVHKIGFKKVTIKWSADDLGYILVCLDQGGFLKVPLNKSYFDYGNGMSLAVHQKISGKIPRGNIKEQALKLAIKKDQIHQDLMARSKQSKNGLNKKELLVKENLDDQKQKMEVEELPIENRPTIDDFYDDEVPDLGTL